MIYILTGVIRTGKTTTLLDWSKTRNDVDGLLCPADEVGRRYFLKVKSKEEIELEVEVDSEVSKEIITIGNFNFLNSAFKKANDYLVSIASQSEKQYLIIDELGKLELKNEGLHLSAEILIQKYMKDEKQHLILVIRDYLLDAVLKHYHILAYKLITKTDLAKNSLT